MILQRMKALSCLCWCPRQHKENAESEEFVRYDFSTLEDAAQNFSKLNLLGGGGFGVVYKGTLKNGKEIAIKRLLEEECLDTDDFLIDSRKVAKCQHKNLVKHLGICLHGEQKLLVYEFIPNTSLDYFLSDPSKRGEVKWEAWNKIILGIAEGLRYLHGFALIGILHRALKPRNILLDESMNPKIADFGMTTLFQLSLANSYRYVKTHGCMPPEYLSTGQYYTTSDVYSFGVIILLIVTNENDRKTIFWSRERRSFFLRMRRLWAEDRLLELMDSALSDSCIETEVIRCLQVAILCVQEHPHNRPEMEEVVRMLTGSAVIPPPSASMVQP